MPVSYTHLIPVKDTFLHLLYGAFLFDGAIDIVKDENLINQYLWPEADYFELNVIYKSAKNISKMINALDHHKKKLESLIETYTNLKGDDHIAEEARKAFSAIKAYYDGTLPADEIKSKIEPSVMIQRMLSKAQEIFQNNIIVDEYVQGSDLAAKIRSFAVYDYLKDILTAPENTYVIYSDVLCAADYGAPQKRMRFVVIGIKRDISEKIALPKGSYDADEYRTVKDAIGDLEDIKPVYTLAEDKQGIVLPKAENLSLIHI